MSCWGRLPQSALQWSELHISFRPVFPSPSDVSMHVPRVIGTCETTGTEELENAASAWNPGFEEHDLWRPSPPLPSSLPSSSPWQPPGLNRARTADASVSRTAHEMQSILLGTLLGLFMNRAGENRRYEDDRY